MPTLAAWLFVIVATAPQGVAGSVVGGLPQAQPRDPRAKTSTGTASISGRVTAADTGAPIRRAQVMLSGANAQRVATTDQEGRYRFGNLSAGTYSLMATPGPNRAGYQAASYGAVPVSTVIPPGKPIELTDGQRVENVDISLLRTGVIAGRVTDMDGEPAARIQIRALLMRPGQEPGATGNAHTDDLGQFRLFGLPAGDYIVMATPGPGFQMMRGQVENDEETTGFAPTYAPGTAVRGEAMRLRVGRGAEVSADIRLVETRVYAISGTAVTSRGEAQPNMSVTLTRSDEPGGGSYGTAVNLNGTFTMRNLPPGRYEITARYVPPAVQGPVAAGPEPQEFASVLVEVLASNVDGVALVTRPGAVVTGEIVFEETPPPGARPNLFAQPGERRSFVGVPQIEVKGTTFTMRNVFGPVVLRGSTGAGPGWGLKAVTLNGRDITDVPTTFTSNDSGRLQVIFTSRAPAVEGVVLDESGKPATGASVVLFAQDDATWRMRSSYLRTTRTNKDGGYTINGLREGRYFAVAVPVPVALALSEPDGDLLEALSKLATPLLLNPGERRTIALTVAQLPDR